jgi:hypothetical protein
MCLHAILFNSIYDPFSLVESSVLSVYVSVAKRSGSQSSMSDKLSVLIRLGGALGCTTQLPFWWLSQARDLSPPMFQPCRQETEITTQNVGLVPFFLLHPLDTVQHIVQDIIAATAHTKG